MLYYTKEFWVKMAHFSIDFRYLTYICAKGNKIGYHQRDRAVKFQLCTASIIRRYFAFPPPRKYSSCCNLGNSTFEIMRYSVGFVC